MPGINDLIASIMGQTQTALDAPAAPWQQELLETVNPEKVKRQNIARALAQASTAMATTPGNFLAGVSAAASTGADSYLTARDEAETERARVQQLVQMQQQRDQDRRLDLLMGALGVQRNQIQDQQSTERHNAGLERDKAYTEHYRQGRGASGSDAAIERKKGTAAAAYFRWLDDYKDRNFGEEPSEEEKDARWNDMVKRFGIPTDEPVENASPQVVQPGKTDQVAPKNAAGTQQPVPGGILAAPPPPDQRVKGQTYETPKGPMIWTGNGWTPAR
ncbi:MAG: hypothetical protein ABFD84_02755 [Candidatus Polarisedimenticolia bacterium]